MGLIISACLFLKKARQEYYSHDNKSEKINEDQDDLQELIKIRHVQAIMNSGLGHSFFQ